MAIDSRDKRASAVHVSSPWRTTFPVADNTIGESDRIHALGYYGAVLTVPAAAVLDARATFIQLGLKGVA